MIVNGRIHPSADAGLWARLTSAAVAGLASILIVGTAAGQDVVREVQVPLDAAGQILEITPELRRAAALFPEVRGFQGARLFQQEDGTLVLEVSWLEGPRLARERRVLVAAEVEAFRTGLSSSLAEANASPTFTREGRGGLVWGATAIGLGFYGWAVPLSFDIDDSRGAVAAYLITAASSFYLPYRLTRDRSVTDAHRSMSLWGATRGALFGGALGFAITDRGGPPEFGEDEDADWQVRLGAATVGSVAGGVLGFKAVDWTGIGQGTADLRETLSDFSTAAGFGLSYVLGLYDDEETRDIEGGIVHEDPDLLPANFLALAVAGAGIAGSQWAGRDGRYTSGDVHVLRSFGLMGAQALLPVANLVDEDGEKTHVAAAFLGAAPGLFFGDRTLRSQNFSSGDGLLVAAGHLAGGLLGAGLTYLVDPDTERDELIYLAAAAAGSAAGLLFTYRALADRGGASGTALHPGNASGVSRGAEVSVNPLGLLPLLTRSSGGSSSVRSSVVSIRW